MQLVLNAAWSPIFFGMRRPDLAFVEIVILWCSIVGTIASFQPLNAVAAGLLLPYLAGVIFLRRSTSQFGEGRPARMKEESRGRLARGRRPTVSWLGLAKSSDHQTTCRQQPEQAWVPMRGLYRCRPDGSLGKFRRVRPL